jgi:4-amino-4-deoxy-L-arabinose transferase-like glycosyltransferase
MITDRFFYRSLLACLLVYLLGMFCIPLMDIDASQYASISREMLENKSFLQVYDLGYDYLDKPPMLFWLSALSMKILGVHDWAYRFPSLLFAILAVYSVYRMALLFYQREIAQLSAMVLAASQALFLITHDVRCDTMLMGWVSLSCWQLAAWLQTGKRKHIWLGFAAIAGGMMTKGPIALMVPVFAFFPHILLRRQWKMIFRWEYLAGIALVAVLLVPMSIGLYQQFDLHPGKMINGVPIQSGLRFYYWTQSFGRYTGENVFNEMNHFTFLLENMIWSFLPWILLFLAALVLRSIDLVRKRFRISNAEEWFTAGGFIITYCALARSQAQLPHYIFVVFPLAAVVTGRFLYQLLFTDELKAWKKPVLVLHTVIFGLLWLLNGVLMQWPFRQPLLIPVLSAVGFTVFIYLAFIGRSKMPKLLVLALYTVIGVNAFLDTAFYPNVLKFQLGNDAAQVIHDKKIPKEKIGLWGIHEGRALHFYAKHIFPTHDSLNSFHTGDYLLTQKDSLAKVHTVYPSVHLVHEGPYFGVTALSFPFLNPATRDKEVPKYVILRIDSVASTMSR